MITRATLSTIEQGLPKYRSMLAGNAAFDPSAFDAIATVSLSTATSSITFSSIPSTYKHLQVRTMARDSVNAASSASGIRFNGDTGNNYGYHKLYGTGSVVGSTSATSLNGIQHSLLIPAATNTANAFGVAVIDILDYTNTNKWITTKSFAGYETNGGTEYQLQLGSGYWANTAVVTSLTIYSTSVSFVANSHFALYGIEAV